MYSEMHRKTYGLIRAIGVNFISAAMKTAMKGAGVTHVVSVSVAACFWILDLLLAYC